jgi:hypothetical protein
MSRKVVGSRVVAEPARPARDERVLLEVLAVDLELLLLQSDRDAQVLLPVLGDDLRDQVVPRVLVEQQLDR